MGSDTRFRSAAPSREEDGIRPPCDCSSPSTLVRQALSIPGWTAVSDRGGRSVSVCGAPDGPFQELSVPAGTTTFQFVFLPPHEGAAGIIALLAMIGLLAAPVAADQIPAPSGD